MTEPFKFVVSNDPAKARQAIGTLGVPADYDVSGSGDYMVNDVVRFTDPAPSPTTDLTGLYACIVDHTSGSPKDQPGKWELVSAQSWAGLTGKPEVVPAAVRNGTSDDRAVLAAADASAVSAGNPLRLLAGTYRVASNLTITSPVHFQGAILKPDNGVTITLAGDVSAPLSQIFDHSAGGKVVPRKVPFYHPGWWGPTGTADDSQAWKDMLVAAQAYSVWQPAQQRIMVPQGTNRLWQVELNNVHLEGNGRSSWIRPASTATPGDPVNSDTGYVVKLGGTTTVSGVEFDTSTYEDITLIAWVGSQINMIQSHVVVRSVGSVGIWAFGGGLGVRLVDCMITGEYGTPSGTGIRAQGTAYDGKLTNVIVKDLDTGIDLNTASWQFTNVHVYGCTGNGIQGVGADNSKFVACWFDKNALWGLKLDSSSNVIVDSATWFYRNGSGGMALSSDTTANRCKGNRIDGIFDDNTAYGLYLKDALQTSGDLRFTSGSVLAGGSALCTTGVYIGSGSTKSHLRVLASLTWPVTGSLVNNQCTTAVVQRDAVEDATEAVGGTTTLSLDSTTVRRFYGTGSQICKLPTTGIAPGQEWAIINGAAGIITVQSSNGDVVGYISPGRSAKFLSKTATPTTSSHWTWLAGGSSGADTNTAAVRDANANLAAAGFIPGSTPTVTAAGTTPLDITSAQVQVFTGSTTQTVKLPTTSVTVGKEWVIHNASSGVVTVQSSDGSTILAIPASRWAAFRANTTTPTTNSHWTMVGVSITSTGYAPSTAVLRDANSNVFANNVITGRTPTVTAAGTTTLSNGDSQTQVFTGSTTQTVKLPTTSVIAGQEYRIINNSSGVVTVQSSGANTIDTVAGGSAKTFMAQVDTPTTAANWRVFTPSA